MHFRDLIPRLFNHTEKENSKLKTSLQVSVRELHDSEGVSPNPFLVEKVPLFSTVELFCTAKNFEVSHFLKIPHASFL